MALNLPCCFLNAAWLNISACFLSNIGSWEGVLPRETILTTCVSLTNVVQRERDVFVTPAHLTASVCWQICLRRYEGNYCRNLFVQVIYGLHGVTTSLHFLIWCSAKTRSPSRRNLIVDVAVCSLTPAQSQIGEKTNDQKSRCQTKTHPMNEFRCLWGGIFPVWFSFLFRNPSSHR